MGNAQFDTPEILERSLAHARRRVTQIRRRRAVAVGLVSCASLLVAGLALALSDPGAVDIQTVDRPEPTRTVPTEPAPTSHTAVPAPTTSASLPPTTLPTTTAAPTTSLPAPPPSIVLPPPALLDVEFRADLTLHRFRGVLVSSGEDYVEIDTAGGGIKRLALGDDVHIGLVVTPRPCCATVTATSTSVLRLGETYLFGSSAQYQESGGVSNQYFGEPVVEIVNAVPPSVYVGMDLEDARRLAIQHQGVAVNECEYPNWPVVGESEWCVYPTVILPATIALTHSKGVVLEARWCC